MKTTIAWVNFDWYMFNASWPACTTLEELQEIGNSSSSSIMMKSCTILEREWNPEPRYVELDLGSINSMGLPNLGYKKYIEFAGILKKQFPNKPIIASIAGLAPADFPQMVEAFQKDGNVDLIEVNLSCPNVPGKPQIAYDFQSSDDILKQVCDLWNIPIGVKLPPYFDLIHMEQMAEVLLKHNVRFITAINSVGNTLFIDPEKEEVVIKPKGWFGWLGGDYIKPIALANVRKFYELVWDKIDIIGVGGVTTGMDAFEFLLAWAKSIQIATQFAKEGSDCFARIETELKEILARKWYRTLEDVLWKLKTMWE